ncbi:MAG: T9SS type A sorting domain-containing protein [Bacteroidales bacterium]|nr:T9SS type A sorting domain-containing protein [Bacteroidales bacterium]
MKKSKRFLFVIVFILATSFSVKTGYSQIVVGSSDMPSAGDTLRVSLTNVVPSGFSATAMDTSWNFSMLEAMSQRVDTFVSATATPSSYQLFFVLLGGANLASPLNTTIIPGLPLTNGYTFFKNSASSYGELGSAYTIQGVPLPAKYDNPDKIYEFPLTPGKTWNSNSVFTLQVPNVAFLSIHLERSSIVDGWGTLTTPFGVFQTLRVKSTLIQHDSVYIDSLGLGFPINRAITEYKWLTNGKGIPLLQINEESGLVTATYRDICRMSAQPLSVDLGPDTAVYKGTTLTLHADVSGGAPPYQIFWNTLDTGSTLPVTIQDSSAFTVLVLDALQNIASDQKVIIIRYSPGIDEKNQSAVQISPNPADDKVTVMVPDTDQKMVMDVVSTSGKLVKSDLTILPGQPNTFDFSDLPKGIYLLKLKNSIHKYNGKLIIK